MNLNSKAWNAVSGKVNKKGAHQKAIETAKNLLNIGLSIENIVKATGLNIQEINKLSSAAL